jgi:predicted DNA-binding antitoxin AbrB/MazE fold protein
LFMVWTVDAIYDGGVLRPLGSLPFRDHERVRVTVQSTGNNGQQPLLVPPTPEGREKLLARMRAGGGYRFLAPLPSREELHER